MKDSRQNKINKQEQQETKLPHDPSGHIYPVCHILAQRFIHVHCCSTQNGQAMDPAWMLINTWMGNKNVVHGQIRFY